MLERFSEMVDAAISPGSAQHCLPISSFLNISTAVIATPSAAETRRTREFLPVFAPSTGTVCLQPDSPDHRLLRNHVLEAVNRCTVCGGCGALSSHTGPKTVANIYIFNLAMADLLCLATLPFWATYYSQGYNWLFGSLMCKISSSVLCLNMFAMITTCYVWIRRHLLKAQEFGKSRQKRDKVLKLVAAVVVAFLISWLPFHALTFLNALAHMDIINSCEVVGVIDTALPFGICMAFANSCINPLLYCFIGNQFQEKLHRLFKRRVYQFNSHRESSSARRGSCFRDPETPMGKEGEPESFL
ncbi:hypothetical protein DUI87_15178 [Hirundo rustica rustica]|uniref:Type-1 angiotensin II receptor n=1 Tax=Hirundo rustica rustica TaxID=333673 RepID=A0A3M0KA18_HIRRU|nr:hypothetical protein DUI87_15178 [Hirundo rustica rustica]